MKNDFNGLNLNIGNLSRISNARSYSISAENPSGEKGGACKAEPNGPSRELGKGNKCRAYETIKANSKFVIANINGMGAIQSMWMAGQINREFVLRIFWEESKLPSVECPLPDFFASPFMETDMQNPCGLPFAQVNSLAVVVNPNKGYNCFFQMPFRRSCRIEVENIGSADRYLFFQINYTLTDVPEDMGYFHARFRRENPLQAGKDYCIIDGIEGQGQYIGTVMGYSVNNRRWWGEGEIKFYIDDDKEYPTICGTGTEDYFGGAFNWEVDGKYVEYSTPFLGMPNVIRPDGLYQSQQRFALYRWHILDPIRFKKNLRVDIQSLGWRSGGRFVHGQHDICSVAYWYQEKPSEKHYPFYTGEELEII